MTIDWPLIARNLAAHLHAAHDGDQIQRILDDAEKDAASIGAPADWWDMVAREYRLLVRPGSDQDHDRITEMILDKPMRS
jgi:hypothetical protein